MDTQLQAAVGNMDLDDKGDNVSSYEKEESEDEVEEDEMRSAHLEHRPEG